MAKDGKSQMVAAGGGPEETLPVASKTKIITKLYLQLNGENVDSMLQDTGSMLDNEKEYIVTMMIEEVIDD